MLTQLHLLSYKNSYCFLILLHSPSALPQSYTKPLFYQICFFLFCYLWKSLSIFYWNIKYIIWSKEIINQPQLSCIQYHDLNKPFKKAQQISVTATFTYMLWRRWYPKIYIQMCCPNNFLQQKIEGSHAD